MLSVSNVSLRFGDRLVLDRVSFNVNPGDCLGLVGPNGAGKSTLLAILAGDLQPDTGSAFLAMGVTVGHLRQGFADLPGASLSDLLDAPTRGLLAAQRQLEAATAAFADPGADQDAALGAYDAALAAFEARGGYTAVDELLALLDVLGVGRIDLTTRLEALSGGQKTRAGLAALLASQPDLLLLDEPTNHLDGDALLWLERFVREYRGAILVVSHDRAFLDAVVTTVLELDDVTHTVTPYAGGYSAYLEAKRSAEEAQADAYARQQREIARIERDIQAVASHAIATELSTHHFFPRARAKRVARTAKVRERKLEKQLASEAMVERPERRWGLALDFGERAESGRDVAIVEAADVELGGRRILQDIDLHVQFGDRIALTGPNGGGKSTLVRLLAGELAPSAGRVRLGAAVVPGRYAQEQETIDLSRTVLDQARAVAPLSETEARTFLHGYLFSGDAVYARAGNLSYGERARLALALLALSGANFLLLDEPLNHLDLPSRERFEEALTHFGGTLLIVLHDRYAVQRLATRVLHLREGRLTEGR